jgi:glycosyltransferase involved in cell wall biosynthesis
MNIILFQRILPSYRIQVFRKLFNLFGIITCYSEPAKKSGIKNAEENLDFPVLKVKHLRIFNSITSIFQNPIPVLNKYKPEIVISEGAPSYITVWILLLLRLFFGYSLVIWSHGMKFNDMATPFKTLRGKIQLWLINRADAVLLYSDKRAEILKRYINLPPKVFVARNTLDTNQLQLIYNTLVLDGKEKIKKELGFKHKYNLIYVGRLLPNKGLEDLIIVFKQISITFDVALHIIGDGNEAEKLRMLTKSLQNIHFYGSIFDPFAKGKMLYASDLFIIPGYVGLSVVDAFAFGCPVITYNNNDNTFPVHSPEVEFIHNGINGLFCDPSPESIVDSLESLFRFPDKISEMSEAALDTIKNEASIEHMMAGFQSMIKFLDSNKT